ncbi:AAA family ATPase [Streptomyces sp. NBC_00481]|uniref:RNA ligase family protein n=1 Tax=unclassified Streptomyces TaxID=2593676 RepID=UPI002DD8E375|nr:MULTISPECIES: RNA ligase family protein [unclassified Streptomyces]WRY96317.1 AAA family ATPase [Streptomyces sp. NBC_00481]
MRTHYPRTRHLPWSPGATADDLRVTDLSGLRGREVVVTEKLDGENTTLYADGLHARSLDSAHHPSRTWVKALQARIGHAVPEGWRVCGENMFARHSIAYDDLDSWFYGFSVWDGDGRCLDWDRTVALLRGLGLPVPRVLWRGVFDERVLRALRLDLGRQEGYVVRVVDGFGAQEFGARVAKWVRAGHVRTDTHWMHAAVVENGLGARAALWAVRSGAPADADALAKAVGLPGEGDLEAVARFDPAGRTGDDRLVGVLAALLHDHGQGGRRARLAARPAGVVGMPLARRVADLVGLHPALHRPYPDEDRRTGLARLSLAADLGLLHAVARATAATDQAREQVEWSALHAEEVPGLDGAALREAFAGLPPDAAVRCRAEAREAYARGRVGGVEEAVAATWRWRSGAFPRLIQLVGPAGSGKSTFARGLTGVDVYVSLDDLRAARGARADQRANPDVLRAGLDRLDGALAAGGTVVWDATSLTHQQRSLVHAVAHRRNALLTHAVVLVDEDELIRRNTRREHPVPPEVLTAQLRRFAPPYPGDAHRTWYIGASGTIEDEI